MVRMIFCYIRSFFRKTRSIVFYNQIICGNTSKNGVAGIATTLFAHIQRMIHGQYLCGLRIKQNPFHHMIRVIAFLAFVFVGVTSAASQNMASTDAAVSTAAKSISTSEGWLMNGADGAKVIYIDLEKISTNVTDMVLQSSTGAVVRQESLSQLSVDSIYEVDYSALPVGDYSIEVRSYTGSLTHKFSVK